jgi:hypothetical protein
MVLGETLPILNEVNEAFMELIMVCSGIITFPPLPPYERQQ